MYTHHDRPVQPSTHVQRCVLCDMHMLYYYYGMQFSRHNILDETRTRQAMLNRLLC
jgi:hypothetical protein